MAQTTVWMTPEMVAKLKEKCEREPKVVHPGLVVSLALRKWINDLWTPGPDPEGLKNERFFLKLEDETYIAALRKREFLGIHIGPIIRRAVQDWLDGKWELDLCRRV